MLVRIKILKLHILQFFLNPGRSCDFSLHMLSLQAEFRNLGDLGRALNEKPHITPSFS